MLPLIAIACAIFGQSEVAMGVLTADLLAFAIPEDQMTPEQKALCGTIQQKFNAAIEKFKSGMMSADDITDAMNKIKAELVGKSDMDTLKTSFDDQATKIQELAEAFDKIKQNGGMLTSVNAVEKAVGDFMETPKFGEYVNNRSKSSGTFELSLKGIISVTDSTVQPLTQNGKTGKVVTDVNESKLNLRDLLTVDTGDPTALTLSWERVTKFNRNATAVSENGMLAESSLSFVEETSNVKRIGTHMNISKRLLKSKTYLVSFILNRLPSFVKIAENYQILFGDGQGDNLKGLTAYDEVKCVSKFIGNSWLTLAAGKIASIKPNGAKTQMIVTLEEANDKIYDGAKVTLAGATKNTGLNATFDVHKMNDEQFAVDFANGSDETAFAAVTATFYSPAYHSVADPNSEDVVNAIAAMMTFGQYAPNAIILNPLDVFAISTEKDTTGRKLDIVKIVNGVKYIGSMPVVEFNGMPAGHYLAGDLKNAMSLVDYTNLTIEFADDVNTKLRNMTTVITQEEVIMPVYMPFAVAYGKLADVKAAINA